MIVSHKIEGIMSKIIQFFKNIYKFIYLKLIIPMKRERNNPEYVARGTAVGLFCGLTPLVMQMNIVFVIWLAAKIFKMHFSLPIGLAWTWVSNTFTNIPLLYIYYITGSFLMGQDIGGYNEFVSFFQSGIMEGIKQTFIYWGKPILLVSFIEPLLPYLLAFAAGAMIYVVVEELIPETSEGEHSNVGTIGFAVGFVLMMILDVALG